MGHNSKTFQEFALQFVTINCPNFSLLYGETNIYGTSVIYALENNFSNLTGQNATTVQDSALEFRPLDSSNLCSPRG